MMLKMLLNQLLLIALIMLISISHSNLCNDELSKECLLTLNNKSMGNINKVKSEMNIGCKAIIFDIYGVLFNIPLIKEIKYMHIFEIGICNLFSYFILSKKSTKSFKIKFFDVLASVPLSQDLMAQFKCINKGSKLGETRDIPPVILLWQAGSLNYQDALNLTLIHIKDLDKQGYFYNATERNMIINSTYISFDLDVRKDAFAPLNSGINILRKCTKWKKCNPDQNKLYILSNMDTEIMNYLKEKYDDIFSQFDGIVISAEEGVLKPDPAIYDVLLERYNLNPANCIFIDDQVENISAAKLVGIDSVLCKNFYDVNDHLISKIQYNSL